MLRLNLLVCCFLLVSLCCQAQFVLKGRVMENKTRITLAGVRVENLSTKQSTVTDNGGQFSIKAEKNQLLLFKVFSYQPDTVLVTSNISMEVYLTLITHGLKDVNVTAAEGPGSFHIYDPEYHNQTMAYQVDGRGNKIGGVVFRMWYWKKDEHKKQRREQQEKEEQIKTQIYRAFSPDNIKKFLPIDSTEVNHFIVLYTPSVRTFQSNNFNMLSYLQNCYRKFNQLSPEQRREQVSLK